MAALAASYPALKPNGDAESVLKYRPTVVLSADYSRAELIAQLRQSGVRILVFDRYATIEDDYANLRRLAAEYIFLHTCGGHDVRFDVAAILGTSLTVIEDAF